MFVDQVDIQVVAGDGGGGCISFRREKFIPRGGPDGGDGGRGGSVHLTVSSHHNTLINYKYHTQFRAKRGKHGEGSSRSGRAGENLVLNVPIGTVVYEKTNGDFIKLADLTNIGQNLLVASGGRGGRGNERFASSTNRAPRRADSGMPGETRHLRLSLKLLADVGLVGLPNVGKSTLLARLSEARPKIADYPFTTLTPHLGVVQLDESRSFVLADVPGLIKGAHEGHGLGHQFLSHLERTKLLVHVIDVSSNSGRDPVKDFEVVCQELASYTENNIRTSENINNRLTNKLQVVAANKIDTLRDRNRLEILKQKFKSRSVEIYPISAVTGEGLGPLSEAMWKRLATRGIDALQEIKKQVSNE